MENPIKNLIKYFQKEPGHALTFGNTPSVFFTILEQKRAKSLKNVCF